MAIADPFDQKTDAGFVRSYDARAARRQLQVSVALVLVLAMATLALGLALGTDRPRASKSWTPPKPHFAESLLDIRS
jgi:hypothetical protein